MEQKGMFDVCCRRKNGLRSWVFGLWVIEVVPKDQRPKSKDQKARLTANSFREIVMVQLIPSQDTVMQILTRTGAFREGHFVYPNGKHSPHYFQMPLAFRYYDTARVLAVALSRKFRLEKDISSQLPKVSIISPSSGGIPVAFGVRDALSAEQIYWAEQENGER